MLQSIAYGRPKDFVAKNQYDKYVGFQMHFALSELFAVWMSTNELFMVAPEKMLPTGHNGRGLGQKLFSIEQTPNYILVFHIYLSINYYYFSWVNFGPSNISHISPTSLPPPPQTTSSIKTHFLMKTLNAMAWPWPWTGTGQGEGRRYMYNNWFFCILRLIKQNKRQFRQSDFQFWKRQLKIYKIFVYLANNKLVIVKT